MPADSRRHAAGFALVSAALFGVATPLSKWLLDDLTPFQLAGLLYLGAALGVAPTAIGAAGAALVRGAAGQRNRRLIAAAVVCGGVLGPVFLLVGLRVAGAASVALWLNLELVATAVLGVLFFHDHLPRFAWWGVLLATAGAGVLSASGGSTGWLAGALVLLACVSWALDNHFTALIDGLTPSQSTLVKGGVAGTVNLALGVALAPFTADAAACVAALAVGAFCYGVSTALYIRSAQALGATRAQVIFASAPVFGVLLAVLWLDEPFTLALVAAALLLAAGVGLMLREAHAHPHRHAALAHSHAHRHDDGHHTHLHEGLPASTRHTHVHAHEPIDHSHPHLPDLHHRHGH
jgi:drug/metabolite transporter (DMT)-like permease